MTWSLHLFLQHYSIYLSVRRKKSLKAEFDRMQELMEFDLNHDEEMRKVIGKNLVNQEGGE